MNTLKLALSSLCFLFLSGIAVAQIEIDKRIELTGSGTDAKITGIKHVTNDEDAVNKKYVDSLVTANSGGGVDLDFTFTASANTILGGSNNNSTPAVTLTATAFAGTITPITVTVTGVPAGATYTLTPSAGYPVPSLPMSLVFQITSVTPGNYPITVTANGGVTPKVLNLTLTILSKRVFVTSTKYYPSQLNGITGADNICAARATAAGLGSTWKAWLSTNSIDAKDRIPDASYVLTTGTVIAGSKSDLLDGSIQNKINVTEFGSTIGWPYTVWTGTASNGVKTSNLNCSEWYSNSSQGTTGSVDYSNNWWTQVCCGGLNCSNEGFLYCFEQ